MTGTIIKLMFEKSFGFIRGEDGNEYFFHRSDFNGHFLDLETDMGNMTIMVTFTPTDTGRGPRAQDVRRTDDGYSPTV